MVDCIVGFLASRVSKWFWMGGKEEEKKKVKSLGRDG